MTRLLFGARAQDFVYQTQAATNLMVAVPGVSVSFWTAQTGGTQVTDLTDMAGNPITTVQATGIGSLPQFYGPDDAGPQAASHDQMWAAVADNPRVLVQSQFVMKGDPGPAPSLTQGTVTTLPAGSSATATISGGTGTPTDPYVWDVGLPQGQPGSSHPVGGVYYLTDYITGTPDLTGGTDYTAALNAAHAAMQAAGGGVLMFPTGRILIAGQVILPNDGGTIPAPTQKPIWWLGTGGHYNGQSAPGTGGTRLILTYQNATYNNAKIVTRGLGVFRIDGMVLQDTTANASTPFLFTTCTTLKISNCAFLGASSGQACAQDAIVLGGTISYSTGPTGTGYGDPDAPFQGYGTVITGSYFNYVRRGVYGRMYCNQVVVENNFFDKGCGTNLTGGACVEFNGAPNPLYPDGTDAFNIITGNYFEWTGGYYYQIKLTNASLNYIAGNGGEDPSPGGVAVALVGCFGSGTGNSAGNNIFGNNSGIGPVLYEDAASLGRNNVLGNAATDGDRLATKIHLLDGLVVPDVTTKTFVISDDTGADLANISGSSRTWTMGGPITIAGNSSGTSTTLTIGNRSNPATAIMNFDPPSGYGSQIQFKRAGAASWLFYDANSSSFFFRDSVNGKMHVTFSPGAGAGGGSTEVNSALKVDGNVGFYGAAPVAKPVITGSRAGESASTASLRAALVALGLVTDSTTA